MEIIESFVLGKRQDQTLCEDGFVATDDYVAVIDGASAKTDMTFDGHSSGKYMMELIRAAVPCLEPALDEAGFIGRLTGLIRSEYERNGWLELLTNEPKHRPTASVVVFSRRMRQLWFYGDCRALVGAVPIHHDKRVDEVTSMARKMIVEAELAKGKTVEELRRNDPGRAFIQPLLEAQAMFQNSYADDEFAYGCVDGFSFPPHLGKTVDVPGHVRSLVLATDGYVTLRPSLSETEALLQLQLLDDPLAIGVLRGTKAHGPGMHSFDDRTYVRLELDPFPPPDNR